MDSKNFICKGNTFTYSKGYIVLSVIIENLPEEVLVQGETLRRKSSFHVSLLCVKNLLSENAHLEQVLLDEFCSFVKDTDISFLSYTGEFRLAHDDERKSLVALCDVRNLTKLFDVLSEKLGIDIPYQPTHVTLYTLQPNMGIGLNSLTEMNSKSEVVQVSSKARNALGLP